MIKMCIIAEIFQAGLFLGLSSIFIKVAGTVGVTYAYAITYAIYFLTSFILFTRYVNRKDKIQISGGEL
jgi:membrane protein implicated in regulation of membrane protease activity